MIDELKKLYRSGRLIPFIGAGVSMSVSWIDASKQKKRGPSWGELVDQASRLLNIDPELMKVRGDPLQILEYFKIKKGDLAPLTNWMYSEMQAPDSALRSSIIHQELANFKNSKIYYTTNYDNFLERSLTINGRNSNVIVTEQHMGYQNQDCEVVKFHGDFNYPKTMVVTESDYHHRLSFSTEMDLKFRADLLGRAVLFIGYSFRDANVAYLFHLVNNIFKGLPVSPTGRRAYIFVPDPSDFEIQLFRARNIEVIPLKRDKMADDIGRLLAEIRS